MNKMRVDEYSDFNDINDALYHHEKVIIVGDAEWEAERERLYRLWAAKTPYQPAVDPCSIKGSGLMSRCIAFFRERASAI